ncbi:phosphopantetheine-binding protein [Streptomyces sp. NPDC019224]|uniref:phosphopantetheine-binding protein n=1 Tax=Streptomyces sp. NPDC019224 TaxID=3154484 RepID=UPI0033F29609
MTESEIFAALTRNLVDVLPELLGVHITPDLTMRELGANSIDRMDVLIGTQETLGVQVPVSGFGAAQELGALVAVFAEYMQASADTSAGAGRPA